MEHGAGRRLLPHETPETIRANPEDEVYFITVSCLPRGLNQLAHPKTWDALRETFLHREDSGELGIRLLLVMPDHLHALLTFTVRKPMKKVIADVKSWLARTQGISWQRDFFDHRLRSWESASQKGDYIRENPYRAGLVAEGEVWPYMIDRIIKR